MAGYRGDVHNVALVALNHRGGKGPRELHHCRHVRLQHREHVLRATTSFQPRNHICTKREQRPWFLRTSVNYASLPTRYWLISISCRRISCEGLLNPVPLVFTIKFFLSALAVLMTDGARLRMTLVSRHESELFLYSICLLHVLDQIYTTQANSI